MRYPSHIKIESHCAFRYLTLFPVGVPSVNWCVWPYDMLHVHSPGSLTIQTIYSCRLCGEIRDRMTVWNMLLPYFLNSRILTRLHVVTSQNILIIKPQRDALISQIYFWIRTLHISDSVSVHHQESSTVHIAIGMSYRLCWLLASKQSA